MSFNQDAADRLDEIARMLELLGEDRFKVNAHARAARAVEAHAADLKPIAHDTKALTAIEGIGVKIAAKITEFAESGAMSEHAELLTRVPAGLLDMMRVPGLGPKTVKAIWETLNVTDTAGLKAAIADGRIMQVPRMGTKTVENIKKSLETVAQGEQRLLLGRALPIAEALQSRLAEVAGVESVQYAGSLRRGKETIGDIDLLAVAPGPASERLREAFCTMPEVNQVLIRGETKCSIRLTFERKTVQADLRIVPAKSWGAALMYFTGSKEHNVRLRERALKRGVTLNEYGLFKLDDNDTPHQHRPNGLEQAVAGDTEESVFKALGLPFIPPELRESVGELDAPPPTDLIELADVRSELHAHTTASDGVLSIVQLATLYQLRGFHTLAITDHSKSSVIANGLTPERLREHIRNIRAAQAEVPGITLLVGSEVDILSDGTLDYDDDLLAELDVVIASPHASLRQEPRLATERLLKAIRHPLVHVIGHPTGRIIAQREGLEPAMEELCAAAAEHNTALEINANWLRLDLRDTHARLALSKGCLLAIHCDTHHPDDAENLRYGVITARRAGCPQERCINTWERAKLVKWLKSKR
ncbi:MAG: DNA polymerase/3'-5' exonuclease PolX [Phycisphaerales bacterium]